MVTDHFLKSRKIGFLGAGNMGQSIIKGLLATGFPAHQLYATTRTEAKGVKIKKMYGINIFNNNEELIDDCDIIVLGVKPQDLYEVIEPLSKIFTSSHIVISLAAGIEIRTLQNWLVDVRDIVRVMPNTAIKINESVIGYCLGPQAGSIQSTIEALFEPMGCVVRAEEGEAFQALTVGCSSGIGFVFELMKYWQSWIEDHGFSEQEAQNMVVKTFLGASKLATSQSETSIDELQKKVVSKKGVTYSGLTAMRELEIEGLLRISFEKAALRDTQLGKVQPSN